MKWVLILVVFFSNLSYTQDMMTNNQQYLKDPLSGISHAKYPFDKKEVITLKSNIMNFESTNGKYHLNFFFNRDESEVFAQDEVEICVKISSKKIIMPYDNLDQKVTFTLTDGEYTYFWVQEFEFNDREAYLEINDSGCMELKLIKKITIKEFESMSNLFIEGRDVYFEIEGLFGSLAFAFDKDVTNFYHQLFEYTKRMYYYNFNN